MPAPHLLRGERVNSVADTGLQLPVFVEGAVQLCDGSLRDASLQYASRYCGGATIHDCLQLWVVLLFIAYSTSIWPGMA